MKNTLTNWNLTILSGYGPRVRITAQVFIKGNTGVKWTAKAWSGKGETTAYVSISIITFGLVYDNWVLK